MIYIHFFRHLYFFLVFHFSLSNLSSVASLPLALSLCFSLSLSSTFLRSISLLGTANGFAKFIITGKFLLQAIKFDLTKVVVKKIKSKSLLIKIIGPER